MILCIVGPTGVGKTKLSIELAKRYNAIVVNGDSMQVYKRLNIGTAKVTDSEKEDIPHLLFDIVDVNDMYTVYDYQKDLRNILEENKDKNIIIVGGTGLYIKAALYNYVFNEEEDSLTYDELSNEELYKLVMEKDNNSDIHINNRKRMVRFLNKSDSLKDKDNLLYDVKFIGLTTDRETLYDRINKRVDIMIQDGLIDEVKSLYNEGIRSKAINTGIGYKELYDYFDGNISLEEAIDLIKVRSRKYAKRQYTWFNNQMDINWFNVDFNNFNNTIDEIVRFLEK
ncbi:MAG: tRNA (adenosine(37)-N6)-dimethylallyltransferase MiaA [Bacilli bacterium]|nr:tRNA (adenosine(37)-N6)-dimethylallyltransferase MiaA [Bacilli bacterium]